MAAASTSGRLRHMHDEPIHPAVRVGHIHLRVADLDRAVAFYASTRVRRQRRRARGRRSAVFLAAGDYHHHVA